MDLWGNLIMWSEKQSIVPRCSIDAEYRAREKGVCEWQKTILEELQFPMTLPVKLYWENKYVIYILETYPAWLIKHVSFHKNDSQT